MLLPEYVKIVEVGPRDGLQNEPHIIDTATKVEFINRLSETGLAVIETTSMVDPKVVPQLADAEQVFNQIDEKWGIAYPVLVPNMKGMERAISVGVEEIALFTSASETFSQKNINCSIAESLQRFEPVIELATKQKIRIRAYISCAFGCPFEGNIDDSKVADLAELLTAMGCAEISLGDTIGISTPVYTQKVVQTVAFNIPIEQLAVHFHNTRGMALANIFASLQMGISIVDASVAGLGGCPFAKSSSGNVATEDVVYMLTGMDVETGIDLDALVDTGNFICEKLQRPNQSKIGILEI
ncbi:hydroxymethylglutaryl-CoA lyase [Pseudomonadota bacterium]